MKSVCLVPSHRLLWPTVQSQFWLFLGPRVSLLFSDTVCGPSGGVLSCPPPTVAALLSPLMLCRRQASWEVGASPPLLGTGPSWSFPPSGGCRVWIPLRDLSLREAISCQVSPAGQSTPGLLWHEPLLPWQTWFSLLFWETLVLLCPWALVFVFSTKLWPLLPFGPTPSPWGPGLVVEAVAADSTTSASVQMQRPKSRMEWWR